MFQQYRLPIASIIYIAFCLLLFPAYRFIFDDDGIGYMMVARRLAEGDYHNAISSYWSPLHSWLVLPLIKSGMAEIAAFKISNFIIGVFILVQVHRLSNKTALSDLLKTVLLLVSIPIIIYYAIFEIAADILFCLLILVYTDLITSRDFYKRPLLNLLCGVAGAALYLTKAYGFPFFILHFTIIQIWHFIHSKDVERKKWMFRNLALGIGSLLLLSAPWIWILYNKFHVFTIGYTGKYNMNVYLYTRQLTTTELVTPPPYPDSPGNWEDPWFDPIQRTPGEYYFRPDILVKQIRLFLSNLIEAIFCFNRLSFLASAILFIMGIYWFYQRNKNIFLFFLTSAILPLGYLMVHIETRFIWAVGLLLLIGGSQLLQTLLNRLHIRGSKALLCWCIFFGSFLITPVNHLKDAAGENAELFQLADFAREKNIRGNYLVSDNAEYYFVPKLAFLTRSSTWLLTKPDMPWEDHLTAMRKHHINYYFYRYNNARELQAFMQGALYKAAYKVHDAGLYNLLVLEIK
ncbi:hypothetical protein [Pseudobacter ginsenosidimutans]|uniref:Dolichyl-phosphate-mannose-protein mannosyltransferase n=1 Tax=Pseudobacter ginsenosidimutans TaxID=661488 RepID=A0A4Q7MCL6_9BACT|nr:hypothetical protein [Pseudobacter ginsenosidimutans]QEC42778.1 hypothetical protein FSB84_14170 [Pseudobacter ginsenosidimutans]RZS65063.1 hypothetical protein EV199_5817 [Pseudobacter ginsenosidimutans]